MYPQCTIFALVTLAVWSSTGAQVGSDDFPAFAPHMDSSRRAATMAHHDRMEELPESLRTPADARKWMAALWEDHGDPGANAQAQFSILMLLTHVIEPQTPAEVRKVIRDGLVAYCQRGGLENLAASHTPWGKEFARALALVTSPGDIEAQEALLNISAVLSAAPPDLRTTREEFEAGARHGATMFGVDVTDVAQWMLGRDQELLGRYREIFGDSLTKDVYAALEEALTGDMKTITDELLLAALERELDTMVPAPEADDAGAPGDLSKGASAPGDRIRDLREELRLLVRHRGDADRVRRVAAHVHALPERRRRQAVEQMLAAHRRVLEWRRPPADPGVVSAIEQELLRIPLEKLEGNGTLLWVRAAAATGDRASKPFREEIARRAEASQEARLKQAYNQVLKRLR